MTKLSKNYRAALEKVGEETRAPLEAMAFVTEVSFAKFDETVEADFRLGIDTRQADQQLRGTVSLPNGSGKTVRVAVFAEGEAARAAEEAGADIVGTDELTQQIQAGEFLGKVSFTAEQLAENYGAVYDEILRMKPAAAKGKYVKSITVSSTMSPGVKVDPSVNRNYTEPAAE